MQKSTTRAARKALAALAIVPFVGAAAAQVNQEPVKAKPPTVVQYTSPLNAFKGYVDEPVQAWREVNDRVERLGGWKAYAKEMQAGKQ